MSLYFTTLFLLLTVEMVMLFIFVLPLPFRIRRGIFSTYNQLTAKQQIKTIIFITGCLVGLLFIDSWKRSQIRVSLYHNDNSGSIGSSAVTPIQALASRAYNQRNMYISRVHIVLFYLHPNCHVYCQETGEIPRLNQRTKKAKIEQTFLKQQERLK